MDINIKKEVLNEGANGLVEDARFNRPAKDGEEYTEEGIYTIPSKNRYTNQETKKRIYVGTNDILKAVAATDKPYNVVKDYIASGAKVESNGAILVNYSATSNRVVHLTLLIDTHNLKSKQEFPAVMYAKQNAAS